jgi:DEAD/DEAH box helicase domain-containing protein
MNITSTEDVLNSLGYDYIKKVEPPIEPSTVNTRFCHLIPEFEQQGVQISQKFLYEHQLKALEALTNGNNAILISGAGSGKTEAWFLYFYKMFKSNRGFRVVAVYPTLALANDQIARLSVYSNSIGAKILPLDALSRDEMVKRTGFQGLRKAVAEANIVITNPAFLFHEVKKFLLKPQVTALYPIFRKLDMLVFDELDFYTPREVALILAIIDILSEVSEKKPQIAILTATLVNPEDICSYLKSKTGRECSIIEGRPFRVENRIYIVLGKSLRNVWSKIQEYRAVAVKNNAPPDVLKAFEDFEQFKSNAYKVLQFLEALGVQVPSIFVDATEILSKYVDEDGVTLVFTRSIARADELAKLLRGKVGEKVFAHHHLVPKDVRKKIEEWARQGKVKIIVSPRTLIQGIDIGTVVRVVHIGLPEDVREFLQREGRKGRRSEIPFSESLIIPTSRWDWELLSKGFSALEKWLSLPLEKVVVNPENKYIALFKGLAKTLSPWYKSELSKKEHEVLKSVGVITKDSSVNVEKAKWIWERINFYEFGPPYGIKRYLDVEGSLKPLEPIGHCDLVERFQMGCFDIGEDAVVVRVESGKSSRTVRAVMEKPLNKLNIFNYDALAEAYEEYKYIKMLWGEEASFLRDIARGKLYSYVLAVVYPPRNGFGELKKIPNRVLWHLTSSKPRIVKAGDNAFVTYDRKVIYVPVETFGEYKDFTYGMIIAVDDREDAELLRLGLAYVMIVLRRVFGIPFETIMYSIDKIGEKKLIALHEPEAAGLLEVLDWMSVRRAVEAYIFDDLDIVLLSQLDEIAYSDFISLGVDPSLIREVATRVINYILLRDRISADFRGKKVVIPKPSKALQLVALDVTSMQIEEEPIPKVFTSIAYFDGEEEKVVADLYMRYPFTPPPRSLREFESFIEDLAYYSDYKLVVFDRETAIRELSIVNLKRLTELVRERAIEVRQELLDAGINPPSLTAVIEGVDVENSLWRSAYDEFFKAYKHVHEVSTSKRSEGIAINTEDLKKITLSRAKIVYLTHLVALSLNTLNSFTNKTNKEQVKKH